MHLFAVSLQLSGCASLDESVNPAVTVGKLHTPAETHPPGNVTKVDGPLLDSNEDFISSEYEDDYPRGRVQFIYLFVYNLSVCPSVCRMVCQSVYVLMFIH